MARKIIIMQQTGMPSDLRYMVAFWLTVPAARQQFFANSTAKSQVIGATASEVSAIQTGAVIERVREVFYLSGTPLATITADLQAKYTAEQAASDGNNPWNRYGSTWDGTIWTSITVA